MKIKVHFVNSLSRRTNCLDTVVSCGSENSHKVVQLNPNKDKIYLLIPYSTLMPSSKKFSPESNAHNPNTNLIIKGIYSKSEMKHHIRIIQFQELLTEIEPIQRKSSRFLRHLQTRLHWIL